MKNLLKILPIAVLLSCSGKGEEVSTNILENLTFTVDTVMVDAGEELLNLSGGIGRKSLTEDKRQLWFFESGKKLVQVDLDRLTVVGRAQFEEEGPDGVGGNISQITIGPNGNLYINGSSGPGIYHQAGKKLQSLRFVPSGLDSTLAGNRHAIFDNSVYDFDTQKIYSHPSFTDAQDYILLILDPKTQSAKSLPVPKMRIVDDYSATQSFGDGMGFYAVGNFISLLPGAIVLTTPAMSGFYRFDLDTGTLEFIDIQHRDHPNTMEIELNRNANSAGEMFENQKKIWEHINYMELMWDESGEMYFRFGLKSLMNPDSPSSFENYLFVYDRDYKVLGETKLEGVNTYIGTSFFKDGKLWSYVNVDDELGFAVFDFKLD